MYVALYQMCTYYICIAGFFQIVSKLKLKQTNMFLLLDKPDSVRSISYRSTLAG